MNILVTGASGFVGSNLVQNLKNIRDGKNRTRPAIHIDEIFEYDLHSTPEELEKYCGKADFVFNFAGVNRPKEPGELKAGNVDFISELLGKLKKYGGRAAVMQSSTIQTSFAGRFQKTEYSLSKREGEEMVLKYGEETGAAVYVYRFPNLAGKWVRPNYNSAVGTFCSNIANDLPITVNDPSVELELLFIDDLMEEMYDALEGHPHRAEYPAEGEQIELSACEAALLFGQKPELSDIAEEKAVGRDRVMVTFDGLTPLPKENGRYCYAPVTHKATLGRIVELLYTFHDQPKTLIMPAIPAGSFEKKLYSMYLSYLPKEKTAFDLDMKCDERGSFTELLKTLDHGQVSVNISRPGVTKGQHWHNSKWEFFIVVSGHGLIQERRVGTDPATGKPYEPIEFEVSGEKIQAVHMLPGYTHNIINLSETENLVTVMWANEIFDPDRPDTFFEPV